MDVEGSRSPHPSSSLTQHTCADWILVTDRWLNYRHWPFESPSRSLVIHHTSSSTTTIYIM
jgi:hypothetical protein